MPLLVEAVEQGDLLRAAIVGARYAISLYGRSRYVLHAEQRTLFARLLGCGAAVSGSSRGLTQ